MRDALNPALRKNRHERTGTKMIIGISTRDNTVRDRGNRSTCTQASFENDYCTGHCRTPD